MKKETIKEYGKGHSDPLGIYVYMRNTLVVLLPRRQKLTILIEKMRKNN